MFKNKLEKQKMDSNYIKECSFRLKYLMDTYNEHRELISKIESVYDLIHSSPVNSHITLKGLETEILHEINTLEEMIRNSSFLQAERTIDRIKESINERNMQLKLLN